MAPTGVEFVKENVNPAQKQRTAVAPAQSTTPRKLRNSRMLKAGYPDPNVTRNIDALCDSIPDISAAVICDQSGLRFYHTDRQKTGESYVDGEERPILEGAEPYITTGYSTMENLRAIGALYVSLSNWIAPDSLGIEYVHELLGKRVAVGPEDSTSELSARVALSAVGLTADNTTLENQGLGSGGVALLNGDLDALQGFAGIPVKGLSDLAGQTPCRVLRFTEEELDAILGKNKQYVRGVIPAGTYAGQTEDVETFGVKCLLCVDADMTSNPLSSLLLGAGITIAIQSSSAVTVMLVGLVNSGVMMRNTNDSNSIIMAKGRI